MTYKLIIDGRLPSMNDYKKAMNRHWGAGERLKNEAMDLIGWAILQQLNGVEISQKIEVNILWVEPNKKRDHDNIASAKKFIFDALQRHGVLKGDGQKYLSVGLDSFTVDKTNPRIEVTILEI